MPKNASGMAATSRPRIGAPSSEPVCATAPCAAENAAEPARSAASRPTAAGRINASFTARIGPAWPSATFGKMPALRSPASDSGDKPRLLVPQPSAAPWPNAESVRPTAVFVMKWSQYSPDSGDGAGGGPSRSENVPGDLLALVRVRPEQIVERWHYSFTGTCAAAGASGV